MVSAYQVNTNNTSNNTLLSAYNGMDFNAANNNQTKKKKINSLNRLNGPEIKVEDQQQQQ